jgi:CHASE3 domain sensor protein
MMNAASIVQLLRTRAEELMQEANAKMHSIHDVSKDTETEEQKTIRASAQCNWQAAQELSALLGQIEQG